MRRTGPGPKPSCSGTTPSSSHPWPPPAGDDWDIPVRTDLSSYRGRSAAIVGLAARPFVRLPHATGDEFTCSDWRTVTEYSPAVGTVNGRAIAAAIVPCSSAVIGVYGCRPARIPRSWPHSPRWTYQACTARGVAPLTVIVAKVSR